MKFPRLPEWCFRLGVTYLVIGMCFGVYMGATENFALRDVHAHFNLLGFVSTFLIGLFLKTYPTALKSKLTTYSVLGILGAVPVLLLTLLFFTLGNTALAGALALASMFVLVTFVAFAVSVYRVTAQK